MRLNILGSLVGVRKLVISVIFLVIIIVLRIKNLINGAEFIDGSKSVLVAYMSTNIGEWFAKGFTEFVTTKKAEKQAKLDEGK